MFLKLVFKKQIFTLPQFLLLDEKNCACVPLNLFDPSQHTLLCLQKGHNCLLLKIPSNLEDQGEILSDFKALNSVYSAHIVSDCFAFLEITRWIYGFSSRYESSMDLKQLRELDIPHLPLIYEIYLSHFKEFDSEFAIKQQKLFADKMSICMNFSILFSHLEYLDSLYSVFAAKNGKSVINDRTKTLVVIPTYGHLGYTCTCLASIYRDLICSFSKGNAMHSINIVISDDCYPDFEYQESLARIDHLTIVSVKTNEKNLGFLTNCNDAILNNLNEFHDYIVLLNNDIEVLPGWLNGLLETFHIFNKVGLVGSQQISFDGSLQDAGGLVWKDGSAWNYGKGQDPLRPEFGFARTVDYISAASVAIPAHIWRECDGFDERYKPAYYEDTDLCLTIQNLGYKVIYQPASKVFHAEGVSNGTDVTNTNSIKRFQFINQEKFVNKWMDWLQYKFNNGENVDRALHSQKEKSALIIEDLLLTPNEDAGSLYMINNCLALQELGYSITYIPADNYCYMRDNCFNMGLRGIEVLAHPRINDIDQIESFNAEIPFKYSRSWDLIILCRPTRISYIDKLKCFFPGVKIIYYTHDLHYSRMLSQAQNEVLPHKKKEYELESRRLRQIEKDIFSRVDMVFHVSEEEQVMAQQLHPHHSVYLNPVVERPRKLTYEKNSNDIVFIGSSAHPPNIEGLEWFLRSVWPEVLEDFGDSKLHIVGKNSHQSLMQLCESFESVMLHGYVESLDSVLRQCSIGIAPLLSGAGVKGKVLTYLSHGLSVVSTSFGAQGIPACPPDVLSIANDPTQFSCCLKEKLSLPLNERFKLSDAAQSYMLSNFSTNILISRLKDGLKSVDCWYSDHISTFKGYGPSSLDIRYTKSNSFVYYRNNEIAKC